MKKVFGLMAAVLSESLVVIGNTLEKLGVDEDILSWLNTDKGRKALAEVTEEFVSKYHYDKMPFLEPLPGHEDVLIGGRRARLYELKKAGTSAEIFGCIGLSLDELSFSSDEWYEFFEHYQECQSCLKGPKDCVLCLVRTNIVDLMAVRYMQPNGNEIIRGETVFPNDYNLWQPGFGRYILLPVAGE